MDNKRFNTSEYKKYKTKEKFVSFSVQSDAINFTLSEAETNLKLFSYETNRGGIRRYVSTEIPTLWRCYKELPVKNYYEVIIKNKSCKFYLDLEFEVYYNRDKNGLQMTESLMLLINNHLKKKFGISMTQDDVLVLESSSDQKFSVHLVYFRLVLQDNKSCSRLIQEIIEKIRGDKLSDQFQVQDKQGGWKWFFDTSVYSSNRNFRLFLSSKLGQKRPLILADYDRSSYDLMEDPKIVDIEYEIFLRSLITNVDVGAPVLVVTDSRALCSAGDSGSVRQVQVSHRQGVSAARNTGPSPYPHIEQLIQQIVYPGYIRSWSLDNYDTSVIVYNIAGTKYCNIAGREHSNNHVFYKYYPESNDIMQCCYNKILCNNRKYRVN